MRAGRWLNDGLVLVVVVILAIMLAATQARFIAKRETPGVGIEEETTAANNLNATSTAAAAAAAAAAIDPDIVSVAVKAAQEPQNDKEAPAMADPATTTAEVSQKITSEATESNSSRSTEHGRAMQLASTTEAQPPAAVTPMKLRALPKIRTTLLPFASNENAIEESTSTMRQLPEKRAKFISENSTNAQQLLLPNTAEVWSLAGMKSVPKSPTTPMGSSTLSPEHATGADNATAMVLPTAELTNDIEEPPQNQTELHKEKNLLDWQQIAMMQSPVPSTAENRTEFAVSTTLDATEEAMQVTTESLEGQATPETTVTPLIPAGGGHGLNLTEPALVMETTTVAKEAIDQEVLTSTSTSTARPETTTSDRSAELVAVTEASEELQLTTAAMAIESATAAATATATAATMETSSSSSTPAGIVPHVSPAVGAVDADQEMITTARTSSIDGDSSAPSVSSNTTEMAMKAVTPHTNDDHDVINVVSPSPKQSQSQSQSEAQSEREQQQQQQQEPTDPTTTAVSSRAAVEESASTTTTTTTTTVPQYELSEQKIETTTTATTIKSTSTSTTTTTAEEEATTEEETTKPTPTQTQTPTEIVQISNEVNLETATVPAPPAPETTTTTTTPATTTTTTTEPTVSKSKEEGATTEDNFSSINSRKPDTSENFLKNSSTTTTTTAATTIATTPATQQEVKQGTEVTVTVSPLFSDLGPKANNEHESSLETNNIGEAEAEEEAATTTTAAGVGEAAVGEAGEAPTLNALDERETGKAATGAKGAPTDEHYDEENDTGKGQQQQVDEVHEKQVIKEEEQQQQQQQQQPEPKQTLAKNMAGNGTTSTTEATTTSTTTSTTATTTTEMQPPLISLLDDSTTKSTTTTTTIPTPIDVNPSSFRPPISMLPENTTLIQTPPTTTTEDPSDFLPSSERPTPPNIIMAAFPNDMGNSPAQGGGTDVNVIIAITVSVIGVVALILLVAFLYLMRKRQKQMSYGQRCRPVSLDAYSLDNVSVLGSVRRKGRDLRASKRTYGNAAFDDPSLRHNLLSAVDLGKFVERRSSIFEEFRDVPQIIARADEVPAGCEDKNRYANVIPLPETRVVLQRRSDDDKTEYINANYVRGPRDAPNYYIACQAPMESTTSDFWRMIWEQQSRVIIQATDLNENGIEKCAEYLPPSATLDNHSSYGDYQVTLKNREVKDKYAVSTLMLKRVDGEECRELTHYWYKWPEAGVPAEEAPIIAMLLEARSSLKSYCLEQQASDLKEKSATAESSVDAEATAGKAEEINGNVGSSRSGTATRSQQGPLTVHCSPGTGRTGTIIASDMAIRSLETPKRSVDIPQLVYYVRRGRASAVQTKEQYEFIYKVANMYATKITNLSNDN
ncbi:flocculation protein FLO11 [Drosophila guanche]|uniref:Blast:Receptor-type tyrosine-protein phosphatase kappa n=1 Tax=Drosophila guanche TaxID=7266 RepID=A0A3B0KCF2_DROGU|nr:flocculation protein FLO11 [Drosophila guanche]SPP83869.1 blast:Receptor-type tyrosine-protein phosphatase kappa [Drosophila guanche]